MKVSVLLEIHLIISYGRVLLSPFLFGLLHRLQRAPTPSSHFSPRPTSPQLWPTTTSTTIHPPPPTTITTPPTRLPAADSLTAGASFPAGAALSHLLSHLLPRLLPHLFPRPGLTQSPSCSPVHPVCNPVHPVCNPVHPVCNPMYRRCATSGSCNGGGTTTYAGLPSAPPPLSPLPPRPLDRGPRRRRAVTAWARVRWAAPPSTHLPTAL